MCPSYGWWQHLVLLPNAKGSNTKWISPSTSYVATTWNGRVQQLPSWPEDRAVDAYPRWQADKRDTSALDVMMIH